jgi:hypothetical protein
MKKAGIALIALVIVGAWYHFTSLDGFSGLVLKWILTDDTEYATGYSDSAFRTVHPGMSADQVLTSVGRPLGEVWMIEPRRTNKCLSVYFENDRIVHGCESRGVTSGMAKADANTRVGVITGVSWLYSRSPHDTHYKMRVVHLDRGRTIDVLTGWYID